MIFALCLPVLLMLVLGGVDIHRMSSSRGTLQDALDAAALAAARSPHVDAKLLQQVGENALRANLQSNPDLANHIAKATFILNADQLVIADATVNLKTLVANVFLPPYGKLLDDWLPVSAHSEVNRSSKNIEVALVLDVTGSMRGSRLTALKAAAEDLVDIVVQPLQTPYYTKIAVVPYSSGVNLGEYADAARGTPRGAVNITDVAWSTGSAKSISNISRANPGVVTSNNHGFVTGDAIWISGVRGMTQINDAAYSVERINANTFSLRRPDGGVVRTRSQDGYNSYSSGGAIQKCLVSDCSLVVTARGHDLNDDETVRITDTRGLNDSRGRNQVNDTGYVVANVTRDSFSIGVKGAPLTNYVSGGQAWCGNEGCQWRVYWNPSNALRSVETGTCVSERVGAAAYTDASPTSAPVSFNYATGGNPCPTEVIQPLTSDKGVLKTLISGLTDNGSTAGQIGAAWGWYAISPSFNTVWPSNGAGPHDPTKTLKAVILMTDGEFNTPYCQGVIARDAGAGSGDRANHIRCDATNGDPVDQTLSLCEGMKARGVLVYTVGFQVAAGGRAARLMSDCATSADFAFLPASGADLSDAFKAIGRDITRLRISK